MSNGESARFQQFEERYPVPVSYTHLTLPTSDPVHAGGFHRDRVHIAGLEPIGQGLKILRETGKLPYRFVITIRRNRDIVGGAANVDACGVARQACNMDRTCSLTCSPMGCVSLRRLMGSSNGTINRTRMPISLICGSGRPNS